MDLSHFRQEYHAGGLRRADLKAEPVEQFETWFRQAVAAKYPEPNAMTLATVDVAGWPLVRTVLLKQFDARGLVFFTNYESRKAVQMEENPRVSLLFPWVALERQVVVQGKVTKISRAESAEYFHSRPRESQLGAWVSHQSSVIPDRKFLTDSLAALHERFGEGEIPLPPFWGGYRVKPETVEFWQGGPARLHDRFLYIRQEDGWTIERLSP
ncbi:MAG: pyridoxamine 5-phosphate oxidase [Akkermansiaceae bacterium]|nr:pyridoxamine 5-phosphate oxidase [Akkermansiaceae bacterium]